MSDEEKPDPPPSNTSNQNIFALSSLENPGQWEMFSPPTSDIQLLLNPRPRIMCRSFAIVAYRSTVLGFQFTNPILPRRTGANAKPLRPE